MIVSSLGHGYISTYLLKEIASNGVRCIGITDNPQYLNIKNIENISIVSRKMTINSLKKSTHLVVTAPPKNSKCPILKNYRKEIKESNIRSIVYISSTGVYGDHKGNWVDENSIIHGETNLVNRNRIKAEKLWSIFCKKNQIILNIARLGGIYGSGRPDLSKNIFKDIIVKNDHFFSRIHVLDISRLIVNILFHSNKNNLWNLVDELPTTRKDFLEKIIKLKKIKKYNFKDYEDLKKNIEPTKKKFWQANRKVSSKKIKKYFRYTFLFPSYMNGLKYTIKNQ